MVDAQAAQLRADRLDVGLGGDPRVLPGLDGVLLGGQAEGVVAHRVQDVVAVHAVEPAGDVGAQVAQRVADVQPGTRGVREHVHHEELGPVGDLLEARAQPAGRVRRVEGALALPAVLPAELDLRAPAPGCSGAAAPRRRASGRRSAGRRSGSSLVLPGPKLWRTGGGHQKTPHAGGVAVLPERFRSARPVKQEPPGHAPSLPRRAVPGSGAAFVTLTGRNRPLGCSPGDIRPMNEAWTGKS